jgi:hypothetical protein
MEDEQPHLVLKVHKLISYTLAKRQEITISHFATLHSIMSSPVLTKPLHAKQRHGF